MDQPDNIELRRQTIDLSAEKAGTDPDMQNSDITGPDGASESCQIEPGTQADVLKQSQESLQKLKSKYQDLYDSAPVGYLTLDDKGLVIEANITLADMLGVERNELVGSSLSSYLSPGSQKKFSVYIREAFASKKRRSGELQLRGKDGPFFSAQLECVPLKDYDTGSDLCRIVVLDITERKNIEEALQYTREELYKLLNAIPIPISINTYPEQIIQEVNDSFLKIARFDRSEIIGKSALDLNWKDRTEADEIVKEVQEKGHITNKEIHLYSRFGDLHTSLISSEKIKLGDKDYVVAASIDITDRKKAEEALKESEAFNASLLNEAPNPVMVSDLSGCISYVNPALEKLTGYSRAEVIGWKTPFPWWPPEKQSEYLLSEHNFKNQNPFKQERYFLKSTGEKFWAVVTVKLIFYNGQAKYLLSNWVDITERKQAEEQIKKNELQLRSILDALTEGVALIAPDMTVVRMNKAESVFLDLSPAGERKEKNFRNPRHRQIYSDGTLIPLEETSVYSAMKRKRNVRNFEVGVVRDDGSTKWLNVNAVPIIDETGSVMGVVRTTTDITEQKSLRDEREQFTKKLLEAQEEERKRISRELHDDTAQYLSLLTLELDSMVNTEHKQLPAETLTRLRKLHDTAERALKEIRRFSHELRPSVLEHFGLTAALELIISEFNTTCNTEVSFDVDGPEKRLPDEVELTLFRIAQEALSNIRKHAEASRAEVNLKFSPRKVRLTITDNGKGFIVRRKNHPTGRGGLGLIGMRERAHLIGAVLKLKSTPKTGTVISVDLNL